MRTTTRRERVGRWAEDSAFNLGVCRITLAAVILYAKPLMDGAAWAARIPVEARSVPWGLEWFVEVLPISEGSASLMALVAQVAAVAVLLGLFSRLSLVVLSVSLYYVLALPQLSGSVMHDHHLWWFAVVLAASPCGDALSVDALIARRRGRDRSGDRGLSYGLPIRAIWLLLGIIYFFPGLWKLLTSGAAWIFSDNLQYQMYAKWAQMADYEPLFRIDRYPWLCQLGALGVVLFELSFLPLVLFKRTRPWAVVGGLVFHQLTRLFIGLRFPVLWLCYPMLIDWEGLLERWGFFESESDDELGVEPAPSAMPGRMTWPGAAAAAVMLAGALSFGAIGFSDAWPFACYPKFDEIAPRSLPDIELVLVDQEGEERTIPVREYSPAGRTQRYWALTWSLLGAHRHDPLEERRLRAYWEGVARHSAVAARLDAARELVVYRVEVSTNPDARTEPPLRRERIAGWSLGP